MVSDLHKNIGTCIDDLVKKKKKKKGIGGFTSPYLPPSLTISTDCMDTLGKLVNKAIDVVFAVVIPISKHKVALAFVDNGVDSPSSKGL